MNKTMQYVVAGCKPWNRRVFKTMIRRFQGRWHYVGSRQELSEEWLRSLKPRYIFFLHWSWKVPEAITRHYECVCFHMTDVPYGRGGSPLQNLVIRGRRHTKLTALRMTGAMDAGPVYLKQDLCLEGSAEEIYLRAADLSARMIQQMIRKQIKPKPQSGRAVIFKRRKLEESQIPAAVSPAALHDFIRMLDAEGYPRAFIIHRGFRYEFSRPALYEGRVVADVKITPAKKEGSDEKE